MSVRRLPTKSVRWEAVIELGTDPETGKRRQKRVNRDPATGLPIPTKKDAERIEREELVTRNRPGYADPSRMTVAALMVRWLEQTRDARADGTHYNTANLVKARIVPELGEIPIAELTALRLHAFYREQAARYTPTTLATTRAVLSAALRDAVRWRLLERSPHEGLRLPRGETEPRPVWTADEARAFLMHTRDAEWGPFWRLLLDTGMRIGEALALTWPDVDLDAATVRIDKTMALNARGGRVVSAGAKTASGRRVNGIAPETVAALRRHRSKQNERRLALGEYWRDAGLVFERGDGQLTRPDAIGVALRAAIAACGVTPISHHCLRHTSATLAVASGVPLHAVSKRLGHKTLAMTSDLYAHASREADERATAVIAGVLRGDLTGM